MSQCLLRPVRPAAHELLVVEENFIVVTMADELQLSASRNLGGINENP